MASTWTENNVATSFGVIQSVSFLNRILVDARLLPKNYPIVAP